MEIEQTITAFEAIPIAAPPSWTTKTLVDGRLHISRGAGGRYTVFLEGEMVSFGPVPKISGLEHRADVKAIPSGKVLAALKIEAPDTPFGNRAIAHVAYELERRLKAQPDSDNAQVLRDLAWILRLLGERSLPLDANRQKGLVGECILLRQLLTLARANGISATDVLRRWFGHLPAQRDFAAKDLAVEVKATGQDLRIHHIQGLAQLEPQTPTERVFVYSIGIKIDPSAQRKLPDFVQDVSNALVRDDGSPDLEARAIFAAKAHEYGYVAESEPAYRMLPGFAKAHLPPALFREVDLDRLRSSSFVGGALPAMVPAVEYDLRLDAAPLSPQERDAVLLELLRGAPLA
ncbi:MAG TPA: PD-(D/E)XK motif protein [Candidatus Thermoplasmatota archaeon]|nr:PD-(D/E)XK motif protein [Candidatus Thermoplasmatota archaeon]